MKSKRAKPTHALAPIPKALPGRDARRVLGAARVCNHATRDQEKRVSNARVSAVLAANAAMVFRLTSKRDRVLTAPRDEALAAAAPLGMDEAPGIIRCKKPQLDASAIAQRVAGQPLPPPRGFKRQPGATGDDAARIESVEPTVLRVFQRDPERVVVRFGYEVIVRRRGPTSTLFFDGDTGVRVHSRTE